MQPQEKPRTKATTVWGIVLVLLLLFGWWVWAMLPDRVEQYARQVLDSGTGYASGVNTRGLKVSSWGAITAGALGDVYLRIVGINGDEVADPEFGLIQLQVR